MKRWLVLGAAVSFTACTPDIPVGPNNSSKYAVAEFDLANGVIPLPNDLVALDPATDPPQIDPAHLHAPETGGTDAQNEFNRDYLNLLDGFPLESTGSVPFSKPINPSTATARSVPVFDITDPTPRPITTAHYSVANDGGTLVITPDGGFWTRGHHYAIAVIGGDAGLRGAGDEPVIGSATWALINSDQALLNCDGGTCRATTSAIPTTAKDPKDQVKQQAGIAKQLEALRLNYAPLLNALSGSGVPRGDIAVLFTFRTTSGAEMPFNPDPSNPIIPFPNDLVRDPMTGLVNIPTPAGADPLTQQLFAGLRTLDGFSTSTPIVSENSHTLGAVLDGRLANNSSNVGPVGPTRPINFVKVSAPDGGISPQPFNAISCLNCTGSPTLLDGGAKPDTLAIVPRQPLDERTTYAGYFTTDLKDTSGKNVVPAAGFALLRSLAPLYENGHTTVSLLDDASAQLLEQARLGYKQLFDNLQNLGLPRKKIALAFAFTTETTMSTLARLHVAPAVAQAPTSPPYVTGAYSATIMAQLAGLGIPTASIGTIYIGAMGDVFALTGTAGTLNPDPTKWTGAIDPFFMTTPAACPVAGCPVVIFGHGIGRDRTDILAIANALAAAGFVAIGIDAPWHGERNTCSGFGAFLDASNGADAGTFPDSAACVPGGLCTAGRCFASTAAARLPCTPGDPGAAGDAFCQVQNLGRCVAADSKCEGSTFRGPTDPNNTSGWNLVNLRNFFATRDNLRQQVISLGQLARVLSATGATSLSGRTVPIDATKIHYVGQSLGGILGTLYSSVAGEVNNAVLNVPGGDLPLLILTSPAFASSKAAVLKATGLEENSPAWDEFIGVTKWIIDPADPVNTSYYLTHGANLPAPIPPNLNPASRRAFVQWIEQDQVFPNSSTLELIRAAVADPTTDGLRIAAQPFWSYQFNGADVAGVPLPARHGFLINGVSPTLTGKGQMQVVQFLLGGPPFP